MMMISSDVLKEKTKWITNSYEMKRLQAYLQNLVFTSWLIRDTYIVVVATNVEVSVCMKFISSQVSERLRTVLIRVRALDSPKKARKVL